MYSPHKHSYLQSRSNGINPRIINRSVAKARDQECLDVFDLFPPFLRLTSEQPNIPSINVDVTRRPLAFGRWALPKLRRELHDKDLEVVNQAVNSLNDIVRDPERAFEAVKLRIPDRLVDLVVTEDAAIRERVCMTLTAIADIFQGKMAIVNNTNMLANLAMAIEDDIPGVRVKAASCLEMLSRCWMAADALVEFGFIQLILENIMDEDYNIITIHLETLKLLMYCDGKIVALENEGFEKFMQLLKIEDIDVKIGALSCLMMVLQAKCGKRLAYFYNILPTLNTYLHHKHPEVYTAAAGAICFATIKTRAKIKAANMRSLLPRLIKLAKNQHEPSAQLYAIKTLTNICEYHPVRKIVKEKFMLDMMKIPVGHPRYPEMREFKRTLLYTINWLPHYG